MENNKEEWKKEFKNGWKTLHKEHPSLLPYLEEVISKLLQDQKEGIKERITKAEEAIIDKYDALGSGIDNTDYWFIRKVFTDLLASDELK